MSERENLLNNLKIDRSAEPSESDSPNKLLLLGVAVVLVGFFCGCFYQTMNLKKLQLLQLNLCKCQIPQLQVS